MKNLLHENKKEFYWLLLVLILAVSIRIFHLVQYSQMPDWDQLTIDNNYHHHWAETIANGNIWGDTTYFRAPFYIYCLGLLYALFGSSLWVGRLFGLAIGLVSVFLTYLLGRKIFSYKIGLGAALIQALSPIMIFFEGELLLDPLFMVLMQAALYLFLIWRENQLKRILFLSGIFFGLASITRPTGLIVVGIVAFVLLFKNKTLCRENLKTSAFLLVGVILMIAPVSLRNLIVARDPVMIASQGGINLYIGNNEAADGTSATLPEPFGINWNIQDITYEAEKAMRRKLRPGEVSSYWTKKALNWIVSNPATFFKLYLKKLYFQFVNLEISNNRDIYAFFYKLAYLRYNPISFGLIFPMAFIGAFAAWKGGFESRLIIVILIIYILSSSLFFVSSRFRLPLLPYYIILAVFGFSFLMTLYRNNLRQALAVTTVIILLAVFSFYTLFIPSRKGSTQTLVSQGLYHIHTRNYPKAITYLKQAWNLDRDFLETNLNLGICYFRMGYTDSALFYFSRERDNFPLQSKAYNNLASLFLVNGDIDRALEQISISLSLKPYDPVANMIYLRAVALKEDITSDSLAGLIAAAKERTNSDIYLFNEAAALMLHRQDTARAELYLQAALTAQPPPIETDDYAFSKDFRNHPKNIAHEKAKAYHQLGYLSGIRGDFINSIRYSQEAIRSDATLSDAYVNLISGYLSSGNRQAADSVYKTAVAKFPDNPQINRLRNLMPQ